MTYKTNLKAYMDRAEISQKELARRIGCTEAAVCRYVSENRVPRVTVALKIADILDTTVGAIWGCD